MSSQLEKHWLIITAVILLSLICGGIILAVKQGNHQTTEICLTTTTTPQHQWEIYIDGAVTNPGFYPVYEDDNVVTLIQAAGPNSKADFSRVKIHIPKIDGNHTPQQVDLNRADDWLLEALPGIGPSKAQAIISYRNQHGPFRRIEDLLQISGISKSTFSNIKNLITVEK